MDVDDGSDYNDHYEGEEDIVDYLFIIIIIIIIDLIVYMIMLLYNVYLGSIMVVTPLTGDMNVQDIPNDEKLLKIQPSYATL